MVHLREHEIAGLRTQYGSGAGADISDAIKDIFGRLVGARMGEGKLSLTDEECIADSFIMVWVMLLFLISVLTFGLSKQLLAGHGECYYVFFENFAFRA